MSAVLLVLLAACSHPGQDTTTKPHDTDTGLAPDSTAPDSETATDSRETGETAETGDSVDTDSGVDTAPPLCDRSLGWKFVESGESQTCGIHTDGCAECWGRGASEDYPYPDTGSPHHYDWSGEDIPPPGDYVSIAMTAHTTWEGETPNACGILSDGSVVCWGSAETRINDVPDGTFSHVTVSEFSACALDTTGSAVPWPDVADQAIPNGEFSDVEAGYHFLLLTETGSLLATGFYDTQIESPSGAFIDIGIGSEYPCAVGETGSVLCWNWSEPESAETCAITLAAPEGPFVDVCVLGGGLGCALDAAGYASCWMVGGTFEAPADETFTQIACGASHVCGVTPDNRIVCWGEDYYGETSPPT